MPVTMTQPIRRILLTDQVVEELRQGLREGRWSEVLPSEQELVRELQVSRVTVRRALQQVAFEGLIRLGGKGCRHRVEGAATRPAKSKGKVIRLLTSRSLMEMGALHLVIWDSIREKMGIAGYTVEYELHPKLYQKVSPTELARLDSLPGTAGWVLFFSTEELQRWFSNNTRPCLVIGPVYPGIRLSNVYPDTVASARHAAGLFHSKGHRELIYLMAAVSTLGDHRGAEAFLEESARLGMNARIHHYGVTIKELRRSITQTLMARPRPTAFFSYNPQQCLTLLGLLHRAGRQVPRDASVLAGWDDTALEYTVPTIACYRVNGIKTGHRVARLLMDLIEKGIGKTRSLAIVPEFVAGESVGRLGR